MTHPLPFLLLLACSCSSSGDPQAAGKGGAGDEGGEGGEDEVSACPGVGFGAGEAWDLPDELPSATVGVGGSADCGGAAYWSYSTFDLTGDGAPDLVMSHNECGDDEIGSAYWRVFPGGADGFGPGEAWDLPDELPTATFDVSGAADCGGAAYWFYSTFDLTGDQIPDLVITQNECGDGEIGRSRWTVFPGGAGGFGPAETWSLPDGLPAATYDVSGASDCGGGRYWFYSTFDLTGDQIPDLVMTQNECGDEEIGKSYWKVFPGGAGGFGPAETWSLPDGLPSATYDASGTSDCGGARYWYYATFDLTGDQIPDLVMTQNECGDEEIGTSSWTVFPGGSSGFGPGETWSLPDRLPSATYSASGATDCGGARYWFYATVDLTGDRVPDLVITQNECGDAAIGRSYWKVFPGEANGFGSGQDWALPEALPAATYDVSGLSDCGGARYWNYSTFDLTGDHLPDLVMSLDECGDAEVGRSSWTVFPGVCE